MTCIGSRLRGWRRRTLALSAALAAVSGVLTACSGDPDPQQVREGCLYAVVAAYPDWDGRSDLLDGLPACAGLTVAERSQLRSLFEQLTRSVQDRTRR